MIHIVGLGPGSAKALTLGAIETLRSYPLYLRTEKHPTVDFLREEKIEFKTFDYLYDRAENFEAVYGSIRDEIIREGRENEIVYAVPGHPMVAEKSVLLILEACKEKGIPYKTYPAVSFVDAIFEALEIDPIMGFRIVDALDIEDESPDFSKGTVITQVFSPYIASRVKLSLSEYMDDEAQVVFIRAAGTKEESIRTIPLFELDRQKDIDHLTTVYVPPIKGAYDFYSFQRIVRQLRDKDNGCPWDKEQTHESLKRYLIEESYEVLEAIDQEDSELMSEELGDVMLQVLLHSAIAHEEGEYNIHEVIRKVSEKMIYRHPHVFSKEKDMSTDEVLVQWDELKKKEKNEENLRDSLQEISKFYPSLLRAEKLQKKARKYGFDWDDISYVFHKIEEEIDEIKEAMEQGDQKEVGKELGDLLFAVVNLSRFLNVDPELCLNGTSDRFISRLAQMEGILEAENLRFTDLSLEELDTYWEIAKKIEKK